MPGARRGGVMSTQVSPVGPHPDAATLLLSALMWAPPADSVDVVRLVRDDDLADPALAVLLAAVRALLEGDKPASPQLVADELRRVGNFRGNVPDRLRAATTAGGAVGAAVRCYAAAAVAESLRRRVESAGYALSTAAPSAAESELAPTVATAAVTIADCAHRLAVLRGEVS